MDWIRSTLVPVKPLSILGRSEDTSIEAMVVAHTRNPRFWGAEAGEGCFEFEPSLCYWSARTWGRSHIFVLNRLDPRVAREGMQRETEWCQDVSNSFLAIILPLQVATALVTLLFTQKPSPLGSCPSPCSPMQAH